MVRVGLTGGVGAGKSTVSARLAELGATVIDADRLAREVVAAGTAGFARVVQRFGNGVVTPEGALDRAALAQRVFDDEAERQALNAIVHPLVHQRREELAAAAPAQAVVVEDIPLLVENGMAPAYPLVIVVDAPAPVRVARLVGRGMPADDAWSRIRTQATDEQRRAAADVWLDNTGTPGALRAQVDELWWQRLVPLERHCRLGTPAPRARQPVIVDPDPTWPAQAARLVARVRHGAAARAHRVDHVGSTAVPGLPAKDVIDLQVVVADLAAAAAVADALTRLGLVRQPGRWYDTGRDGTTHDKVVAVNADPARAVNLHVRPASSPAWRDTLLLRDWLRVTPAGVAEYAALKRRLAADEYESMDDYAGRKTPWIAGALARADAWAAATGWSGGGLVGGRATGDGSPDH